MGASRDPKNLEKFRRARDSAGKFRFPEWMGTAWRGAERAERLLGLGVGAAVGATSPGLGVIPGVKDWLPDPMAIGEASRQFWGLSRQGDWDAAITKAQDVMDAGPGYWGLSELAAGAVIPTGVPARIGTGLIRTAPTVAKVLSRLAPAASKEAVRSGLTTGITGLGKASRAPWEAEEWLGRQAMRVPASIFRGIRKSPLDVDEILGRSPTIADEALEDTLVGPSLDELTPIVDDAPVVSTEYSYGGPPEPLPVGESPYEQLPFGETEFPIRGQRELAEELLNTRAGIKIAIQTAKTAREDAGIAMRRAATGGAKRKALTSFRAAMDDADKEIANLQQRLENLPQEVDATPRPTEAELKARNIEDQRPEVYDQKYADILDEYAVKQDNLRTLTPAEEADLAARGTSAAGFTIKRSLADNTRIQAIKDGILGAQENVAPDVDILGFKAAAEEATDIELFKRRIHAGLENDWEIDSAGNIISKQIEEPRQSLVQPIRTMDEVVLQTENPDVSRTLANKSEIVRNLVKFFNPTQVGSKVELRGLIGRVVLRAQGEQKTQFAMAHLMQLGRFSDLFGTVDRQTGFISLDQIERIGIGSRIKGMFRVEQPAMVANPFAGIAPNDLRTNWRTWLEEGEFTLPIQEGQTVARKGKFELSEQQQQWLDTAQRLEEDKKNFLEANGIDVNALSFENGGEYAGRRVYALVNEWTGELKQSVSFSGRDGGRLGSKLSSSKERLFKTQAEALDAGYRYLPEEEVLSLNIQAAYNSVADKQFTEWLLREIPKIGTPKAENARIAYRTFLKGEDASLEDTTLGKLFGGIAFRGPDAREVTAALSSGLDPASNQFNTALKAVNQVNAVARFFTLAGDVSPFLIQLLYMVGTDPVAYGKAMRGFAEAFMNPNFHDTYLVKHNMTTELHPGLITTRQGSEMTESLGQGGLLRERVPGPGVGGGIARGFNVYRSVLSPFQRGFNAALDVAGIEMAEGLEHLARNADGTIDNVKLASIDDFVNEMRGISSSAKLGVSPSMQQVETTLLLAPRYNRAIAALLWDTTVGIGMTVAGRQGDLTLRTKLARDGMLKVIAGLSAMNVALTTAHYISTTEEDMRNVGDWGDTVIEHLKPTSSEFFTWEVLGRNIGPGTKVRSAIQLIARSFVDPSRLNIASGGITMENPLVRFLRGSSAPVVGRSIDVLTGYTYVGEPTRNEIGDLAGWVQVIPKVFLPNFVPIWTQAALFEGGTVGERLVGGTTEFFGGRGSPLTRTQEKQKYHKQDPENSSTPWENLSVRVLQGYERRLTEETGDPGHRGPKGKIQQKIDDVNTAHFERVAEISVMYLSDNPFAKNHHPKQARQLIAEAKVIRNDLLNGPNGFYEQLYGKDEREEPDPDTLEHTRWAYYKLYEDATDAVGKIDYEKFEPEEMRFWASLDEEQAEWLLDSINLTEDQYDPKAQQLAQATRWISKLKVEIDGVDINYWSIAEHPKVLDMLAYLVPSLERPKIAEYMAMKQSERDGYERGQEAYRTLAEAKRYLEKSPNSSNQYLGGLIHNYKDEFLRNSPKGWLNTMVMYGFGFSGDDKAMDLYRGELETMGTQSFREAFYLPPYQEQYKEMMKDLTPLELIMGR